MMMISDNLSTNFVVDFLGGIEGVNRFIKEDLRLENSRLVQRISSKLLDGGQFGWMTSEDLFSFYETVLNSEEKIQDKFFYYMSKAKDFSMARLGRYLPIEGFYEVAQPEISYYGSKGGTFPRYNMTHDTAFIRTVQGHSIGIAVFTEGIVDTEGRYSYHVDHEPILAIAQLGKLLYQYLK